jgi:hypothetical protein
MEIFIIWLVIFFGGLCFMFGLSVPSEDKPIKQDRGEETVNFCDCTVSFDDHYEKILVKGKWVGFCQKCGKMTEREYETWFK